ncbi:unnamed protein product [Closterium sp. NIES-53]
MCRDRHPQTSHAQRTTHGAAEQTGSHGCAAAADAGYHQGLHAAWLHRDRRHHLRTATTAAAASTASATASTASTAATNDPTPRTTPTTTSTSSTASSTSPSTTLASLAFARVASPTRGRRSADLLSANEVVNSSRGNRREKGDRGTPLKEGGATVTARSTNS